MSEIHSYISPHNILVVDTYSNEEPLIHSFQDVSFRIEMCDNFYNFHSPMATVDNKIINISNKQLSFLLYKYHHFVGDELAIKMKNTYDNLQSNTVEYINEEVFQFIDYESISGTGHAYDLMFYLLYMYKKNNVTCKLLVVNSPNKYYNILLKIISKYYNVEYIHVDLNTNYKFKTFYCTRTYQNILFNEVKDFINNTLIDKIIENYSIYNFYSYVSKLKYTNQNNINRCNDSFLLTDTYNCFLKKNNILDLNFIDDEEYKIYLLNKATNIIVSCSSSYYINICYYIKDYDNKHINVVFHSKNSCDLWTLSNINNKIHQHMPYIFTGDINNHMYNNISYNGSIISNINTIDEIINSL